MSLKIRAAWTLVLLGLLCLAPGSVHAQGLRIQFEQVFEGFRPVSGTWPLRVALENGGRDVRGVLTLSTDGFQMAYPVELPRGSRKVIPVYPELVNPYGEVVATFSAPGVVRRTTLSVPFEEIQGLPGMAVITDASGSYGFLLKIGGRSSGTVKPGYVEAEDAPDRTVGYRWASFVLLGDGAERLSDRAVAALKGYLVRGGVLVFLGGASAPVLADARWAEVLPASGFRLSATDGRGPIIQYTRLSEAPSGVALQQGTPRPGASALPAGGAPLVYERAFGLRRAVVLAVNPTEAPLEAWPGRGALLLRALRQTEASRVAQLRTAFVSDSTLPQSTTSQAIGQIDPFSAELPPVGTIAALLSGYVLCVAVVGLILAKGMKRGELLWVAAPVLSLVFAGVLFGAARGLYSAELSTSTRALVLQHSGSSEAFVLGRSQMFFPQAGRYDLRMPVADRVSAIETVENSFGGPRATVPSNLGAVDTDGILVPAMPATSLAFRQLNYEYAASDMPLAEVRLVSGRLAVGGSATLVVRNTGRHALANGFLRIGGANVLVPRLGPGEARTVQVRGIQREGSGGAAGPGVAMGSAFSPASNITPTLGSGARPVTLIAEVDGYRAGPQIGKEVRQGQGVFAIVTTDLVVTP